MWLDAHRVYLYPGVPIIFISDAFEPFKPFECMIIALFSENIGIYVKEHTRKGSQILQFRAHFCRNCKFHFFYMERVPGGQLIMESDSE